jgi:hypothetical protein
MAKGEDRDRSADELNDWLLGRVYSGAVNL